jgi:hypothetical protein
MVVFACHPSYAISINKRMAVQAGLGINARTYLKNNQSTRVVSRAQVVKHEALSSSPSTPKQRTNNKKQ